MRYFMAFFFLPFWDEFLVLVCMKMRRGESFLVFCIAVAPLAKYPNINHIYLLCGQPQFHFYFFFPWFVWSDELRWIWFVKRSFFVQIWFYSFSHFVDSYVFYGFLCPPSLILVAYVYVNDFKNKLFFFPQVRQWWRFWSRRRICIPKESSRYF